MSEHRGINSSDVKNRNRGLVLRLICRNAPVSRIEIAKLTGLSKMTVTNIISELIETQYIIETSIYDSGCVGRNRIDLDISPRAPKIIGIYCSRTSIRAVLCDLKLNVLCEHSCRLCNETPHTLKEKLIGSVRRMLQNATSPDQILGIGVASLGPLDTEKGSLINPPNFFGIQHLNIVSVLKEHFCLPVFFNNDMNAAALAEQIYGGFGNCQDFLYLGITDGVGAGIISGGNLFHNGSGLVGELGHMSIDFNGKKCHCGNKGCLELYSSMPALLNRLGAVENLSVTPKDLQRLYANSKYLPIFDELTKHLATALISAVNILSPDYIVVGHEGTYLPNELLKKLEEIINGQMLAAGHFSVKVFPAFFKERSPLLGSICLVLKELFDGKPI